MITHNNRQPNLQQTPESTTAAAPVSERTASSAIVQPLAELQTTADLSVAPSETRSVNVAEPVAATESRSRTRWSLRRTLTVGSGGHPSSASSPTLTST